LTEGEIEGLTCQEKGINDFCPCLGERGEQVRAKCGIIKYIRHTEHVARRILILREASSTKKAGRGIVKETGLGGKESLAECEKYYVKCFAICGTEKVGFKIEENDRGISRGREKKGKGEMRAEFRNRTRM